LAPAPSIPGDPPYAVHRLTGASRRHLIDARVQEILSGSVRDLVAEVINSSSATSNTQAWDTHQGTLCVGVAWDVIGRADLCDLAAAIGTYTLCAILFLPLKGPKWPSISVVASKGDLQPHPQGARALCAVSLALAMDYRARTAGLPDVMLWPSAGGPAGSCRILEVKSPNDRLSPKQQVNS
jgi:hypothetical protein